jgi:hypothetical protein
MILKVPKRPLSKNADFRRVICSIKLLIFPNVVLKASIRELYLRGIRFQSIIINSHCNHLRGIIQYTVEVLLLRASFVVVTVVNFPSLIVNPPAADTKPRKKSS